MGAQRWASLDLFAGIGAINAMMRVSIVLATPFYILITSYRAKRVVERYCRLMARAIAVGCCRIVDCFIIDLRFYSMAPPAPMPPPHTGQLSH